MQAQLFISGTLLTFLLAPASFACGPDNPDQVTGTELSVSISEGENVLQFSGQTAKDVFEHLGDPEVKRFSSDFFQLKIGFGVICVEQSTLEKYQCWERFSTDGEVKNYFPYENKLMDSKSWLFVTLKGPSMEQLFNRMSESADVLDTNSDGSIVFLKQRQHLSCAQIMSVDGSVSFQCNQFLSGAGWPKGGGMDPAIGSGTRPLTVEEGANR